MGFVVSKQATESRLLEVLDEHGGGIDCLAVSEDCTVMATGSQDTTIRLWSIGKKSEALCVLHGHEARVTGVTFSDESLVSCSTDKTVRRWDTVTGECVYVCRGHLGPVTRIICTGDFIYSSSYDKTTRCWDFDTGECIRVFRGHLRGIFSMVYIPIDDAETSDDPAEEVNCSRDVLVTGSSDGTAKSWSIDTAQCLHTFKGHKAAVTCLTTDEEGKVLFTGSMDQTIRSWKLETGKPLCLFTGHEGPVLYVIVVNKVVYSSSSDQTVRAWLKDVGDPLQVYKGHKMPVSKVVYHQGIVYTASGDSTVRGFEARNGGLRFQFIGHQFSVNSITIVNGRLYSVSDDGTLRVWRLDRNALADRQQQQQQQRSQSVPLSARSDDTLSLKQQLSAHRASTSLGARTTDTTPV